MQGHPAEVRLPATRSRNLLGFLLLAQQSIPLRRLPLLLALASGLGAGTLGVHLLLDLPLACLLGLGPVDLGCCQYP